MQKEQLSTIRVFPCLLILLTQFCTYPYVFYILLDLPAESIMYIVSFCVIAICSIFTKSSNVSLPQSIKVLMIIQVVIWFLYFLMFSDTSYLTRIFFIVLTYVSLEYLYRRGNIFRIAKFYDIALTIQGFLGIIGFILVFIGILMPLLVYHYSEYRYLNWYGFTCSNAVMGNFIRVGGFFDEPGALAFWGIFALLFNKLFFNNKRIEYLLIFSLLFTFSAAYFVLLPVYFICFYFSDLKKLFRALLIIIPILVLYSTFSTNPFFLYLTTERFQGGEIRSTRYEQSDHTKEIFLESPIFGIGAKNMEEDTAATDNPYEIFAKDGLIGFTITYLPLFFIAFKYWHRKEILFSCIILLADYMQRPFHINQMHFFMLYLFSCLVLLKYKCKDNLITVKV